MTRNWVREITLNFKSLFQPLCWPADSSNAKALILQLSEMGQSPLKNPVSGATIPLFQLLELMATPIALAPGYVGRGRRTARESFQGCIRKKHDNRRASQSG
jgi:hypothetical protein